MSKSNSKGFFTQVAILIKVHCKIVWKNFKSSFLTQGLLGIALTFIIKALRKYSMTGLLVLADIALNFNYEDGYQFWEETHIEQFRHIYQNESNLGQPVIIEEDNIIRSSLINNNSKIPIDFRISSPIFSYETYNKLMNESNLIFSESTILNFNSSLIKTTNKQIEEIATLQTHETSFYDQKTYYDPMVNPGLIGTRNPFIKGENSFLRIIAVQNSIKALNKETKKQTPIFFYQDNTSIEIEKVFRQGIALLVVMLIVVPLSSAASFYTSLEEENVTQFLNLTGFSHKAQLLSVKATSIALSLTYILIYTLFMESMLVRGTFTAADYLITFLVILFFSAIIVMISIIIIKVASKNIRKYSAILTFFAFFSPIFLPQPTAKSTWYKYLFYLFPSNTYNFFIKFKAAKQFSGFEIFSNMNIEYQGMTLLYIFIIGKLIYVLLAFTCITLFSLEKSLLDYFKDLFKGLLIKLYNLRYLSLRRSSLNEPFLEGQENTAKNGLTVKNLTKVYKSFGEDFTALSNINFSINPGEKVAFLGHNGSGKTTLISSLLGLIPKTKGEVILHNTPINSTSDVRGKVGYCPQYTATIPCFTILENLQIISSLQNIPKETLLKLLTDLELEEFKNKFSSELSGGQKRKLAFSMAILAQSPLIILDEPSTGVDVLSRKTMFSILRDYSKDSIVVFSTHLIEEAEEHSDRILILSSGKLMAFDTVTNIKRKFNIQNQRLTINYANKYTCDEKTKTFEFLSRKTNAKILKETEISLVVETPKMNYNELADVYDFINLERQNLKISSFGFTKASLEEVLALEEFREEKTEETTEFNSLENLETDLITKRPSIKKITPFSVVKSLLYIKLRSLIFDFKNLFYLIVVTYILYILFYSSNFNNENSYLSMTYDFKNTPYTPERKLKIRIINSNEEAENFAKILREKSPNKEYLDIQNLDSSEFKQIKNSPKFKNEVHKYFFKLQPEADIILINLTNEEYFQHFTNEEEANYDSKMKEVLNEKVILVVNNSRHTLTYSLFAFIWSEYLIINNNNSANFSQKAFHNNTFSQNINNQNIPLTVPYIIMSILLTFLSNRYIKEHLSGVDSIWCLNGIPRISLVFFNVIFNSFLVLILFLTSKSFGFVLGNDSLTNLDFDKNFLLFSGVVLILVLLLTLLAEMFEKTTFTAIQTNLLFAAFMTPGLRDIFGILKKNWLSKILLLNPFVYVYQFLLLLLAGELPDLAKQLVYTHDLFGKTKENWGDYPVAFKYFSIRISASIIGLTALLIITLSRVFQRLTEVLKSKLLDKPKVATKVEKTMSTFTGREIVNFDNVNKVYGLSMFRNFNHALKDFNLTAFEGDHIGVLGANGGGKSTAFKILVGNIYSTSGNVFVEEKSLDKCKPGYMGYVPQYEALLGELTPFQTLKFYGILYGKSGSAANKEIDNILRSLKLNKNKNKAIRKLSGGNKRKVILAVVMYLNRSLIVLDEPTTGIDITNCQEIWKYVQENNLNKTILLASHSIKETEVLANMIIVLVKGNIVACGTKEKIKESLGKHYEIEVEMKRDKGNLTEAMENAKEFLSMWFDGVKFEDMNNFKFLGLVGKHQTSLAQLVRLLGENQEKLGIDEFYVNESRLEEILSEQLEENK